MWTKITGLSHPQLSGHINYSPPIMVNIYHNGGYIFMGGCNGKDPKLLTWTKIRGYKYFNHVIIWKT